MFLIIYVADEIEKLGLEHKTDLHDMERQRDGF